MINRSVDARPQHGDDFICEICGMEVVLVSDCKGDPSLACCGQPLTKIGNGIATTPVTVKAG